MKQTIKGLALPFDLETRRHFRRWKFLPGSIVFPGWVPLLRAHDNALRIGRIEKVRSLKAGFKVMGWSRVSVPAGTPLSVGFWPEELEEEGGVLIVRRARLEEVSVVRRGAYREAKVA